MKIKIFIIIFATIVLFSLNNPFVEAGPSIIDPEPGQMFDLKQNETFIYKVKATDEEENLPIEFDTAEDKNLSDERFSIQRYNDTSAIMNMTPANEDVGNISFQLIATNKPGTSSGFTIHFNISNLNTPPEITSYSPEEPVVAENSSIMLYLNATDDDIIHGSDLNYTWYLNGVESGETDGKLDPERININQTKANFSPRIEDFDAGMHNITVVVEDWEGETANHTWDVNVTNVNRKPELVKDIGEISWEENTNLTGKEGLNLTEYFYHPDTNGTLEIVTTGFELEFGYNFTDEDFNNITIEIVKKDTDKKNATAFAEFYPEENWHGEAEVKFFVYDDFNDPVYSNSFYLKVDEVYEPSEIQPIDDQIAYRFVDFSYEVDVDERYDIEEYRIESHSLGGNITIDDGGLIEFYTENEDHIGNHTINITVENEHGLNSSEIFDLEVKNNTRPVIHTIDDFSVYQHNFSTFNVTGEDEFSDSISFTTNLSDLPGILGINEDGLNFTTEEINETARNFSFKPIHQKLVGNHTIGIYAEDEFGANNSKTFELEIINVPTPPNISDVSVPNDQIKVNTSFEHIVEAFDMEGNIEEFTDNSTLFNITTISTGCFNETAMGNISFTPNETGFHTINISVNDSDGQKDWTIFNLNITENHEPFFTSIRNITTTRVESDSQDIYAQVFDWQDELELDHNLHEDNGSITIEKEEISLEDENGREYSQYRWDFEFNPETHGDFEFDVWVTDGTANDTRTITANVSDVPEFIKGLPDLEEGDIWNHLIEGTRAIINITAESHEYRQREEELGMSASIINFTSIGGEFYNKTEFEDQFPSFNDSFSFQDVELDDDRRTRGTLDFTPEFENAGKYWVNISAEDDNTVTSEIFSFEIEHILRPIKINWSYEYPPGDGFSELSNESSGFINCEENKTISFNTTIYNPNKRGMNISLYEIKDSNQTLIDHGEFDEYFLEGIEFSYDIPFYAHPNITFKLSADDGHTQTNVSWLLNASNVNRDVLFGKKQIEFIEDGELKNTSIEDGRLVLNRSGIIEEGNRLYHENGSYISPVIDIGMSNSFLPRFYYTDLIIEDLNNNYDKYNITYYTATGSDEDFTPDWQEVGNKSIESENLRYIMFKAEIQAKNSSVTNTTPELSPRHIKYNIQNQEDIEGTEYFSWIDLDDFFYDPDGTQLNFSYDYLEGEENTYLSIRDDGTVELHFEEEGISIVQFSAKDEHNSTSYSNEVEIIINPAEGNGGENGGGTETRVVTETRTETVTEYRTEYITEIEEREVEDPVALNIIHPEDVTIYENETMTVPIALRNEDTFTLRGLDINAYSENEGLNISLDRDHIEELSQNSQEEINLEMDMLEIQESYNVIVEVNVDEPEYEDSAKILISPLTRAREGEDDAQLRMAFVRDLLERHKECAELEQYVGRAMEYAQEGDHARANELLDDFIHDCRVLIEDGGIATDQPALFARDIISYIREDTELLVTSISIAALAIVTLIAGLVVGYRKL